jgi:hypothetical protein
VASLITTPLRLRRGRIACVHTPTGDPACGSAEDNLGARARDPSTSGSDKQEQPKQQEAPSSDGLSKPRTQSLRKSEGRKSERQQSLKNRVIRSKKNLDETYFSSHI